jgi:hypothetical protein
MVNNDQL